jgi:Zn-dependent M28 family amino/carboxypeptidase
MKRRTLLPVAAALAVAALALPSSAQNSNVASYAETVQGILAASLSEGEAYERLARLCEAAPHRLAGSKGAEVAVEFMRAEMEAAGFENVRLEPCMVPHWDRGEVERLVVHWGDAGQRLPILALGGSVATPEDGISAGVIEVRDFEELKRRKDEAAGKVVFFNRPMDPALFNSFAAYGGAVNQRGRGAIEAAKVGAVAVIVRSMTTRKDDFPHTGAMNYQDGVPRIPAVAVSTNGAELLSGLIEVGLEPTVDLKLDCQWFEDKPSFNVVGELRGSELPEEVIVVGGHLDAWDVGQGAHDDGGGCVQSFEVVRLLKALDLRPRRTIRAVMFMNEENGLRGGRAYHADHEDEMERHVMALESDRGVFTPRGFTSDAGPAALAILREIVALMEDAGIHVMQPGYGGVDISPMAASGVPLVGFLPDCQRYFDLHHSARDTMAQVSDREVNLGAGAMAALCYVVADLPEALPANPGPDED